MKLLCSTDVNCYHLFLSILVQLLICFLLSLTFPPKVFFPPFFKNGFFFMFSLSFQPTLINFSNKFIGCWTTSWCTWRKSIWGYLFVPCTQVPGFRPGKKIPENILINYIGKQYVQQAAVESILKRTLPHAMSSVCNTVSNNFHFCTLIKQLFSVISSSRVFRVRSLSFINDIEKSTAIVRTCVIYQNFCFMYLFIYFIYQI